MPTRGLDGAALDGAAVAVPPPLLHAARNAALADMAPAHMKPRRLIGIRSRRASDGRSARVPGLPCRSPPPGRPGSSQPHPPRIRFASSCHRTTTGSPGPTPGAPPAPAAFWWRTIELARLLCGDPILGLVAEVRALLDASRTWLMPSEAVPTPSPGTTSSRSGRVATMTASPAAGGRVRVGQPAAQRQPTAGPDDRPGRRRAARRPWHRKKFEVPMKSATNRFNGRSYSSSGRPAAGSGRRA